MGAIGEADIVGHLATGITWAQGGGRGRFVEVVDYEATMAEEGGSLGRIVPTETVRKPFRFPLALPIPQRFNNLQTRIDSE
jgi:hypothetical protein